MLQPFLHDQQVDLIDVKKIISLTPTEEDLDLLHSVTSEIKGKKGGSDNHRLQHLFKVYLLSLEKRSSVIPGIPAKLFLYDAVNEEWTKKLQSMSGVQLLKTMQDLKECLLTDMSFTGVREQTQY